MQWKFGDMGSLNLWDFETKKLWIMTPFSSCSWPPYVLVASSIIAESCCGLHPLCCGQMAREIIDFVLETICVPDMWSCQSRAFCLIFVTFSMWARGIDRIYFSLDKGVAPWNHCQPHCATQRYQKKHQKKVGVLISMFFSPANKTVEKRWGVEKQNPLRKNGKRNASWILRITSWHIFQVCLCVDFHTIRGILQRSRWSITLYPGAVNATPEFPRIVSQGGSDCDVCVYPLLNMSRSNKSRLKWPPQHANLLRQWLRVQMMQQRFTCGCAPHDFKT